MRIPGTGVSACRHTGPGWIDLVIRFAADSREDHDLLAELLQSGARAKVTRCDLTGDGVGIVLRIDPGPADGGEAQAAAENRCLDSVLRNRAGST